MRYWHTVQQSIKETVPARARCHSPLQGFGRRPSAHVPCPVVESQDVTFVLVVEAQISNRADLCQLRRGEETHSRLRHLKHLNVTFNVNFILTNLFCSYYSDGFSNEGNELMKE